MEENVNNMNGLCRFVLNRWHHLCWWGQGRQKSGEVGRKKKGLSCLICHDKRLVCDKFNNC